MREFEKVMMATFKEMFRFKRFKIFSLPLQIFAFIVMSPMIVLAIIWGIIYQIEYFFISLTQIPSDYIKKTIDENKQSPAVLVVVYLVAYPTKFFFDLLVSLQFINISIIYFCFQVSAYLACWGGFKYQPYLMKADLNIEKSFVPTRLSLKSQIIIGVVSFVIIAAIVAVLIISPLRGESFRILSDTSVGVNAYVEDKSLSSDAHVVAAYYIDSEVASDYAIIYLEDNGNSYYFTVNQVGDYSTTTSTNFEFLQSVYKNWFTKIENVKIKAINAHRLTNLIPLE